MATGTASAPAKSSAPSTNPFAAAAVIIAAAVGSVAILKIPALTSPWAQTYDPMGTWWLSTIIAALPVLVLLGTLAIFHVKAHYAALLGLGTALLTSIFGFHMPARMAGTTAVYGVAYGLLPIGWIVVNVIFMYNLTNATGLFKVLQESLTGITQDRRLQLLLIAFCFGSFFEGAAGFGTPVAVTAAILIGLGFSPLSASGLSLIANTAPVAFGALGIPLIALNGVTGIDLHVLSANVGRVLTPFCILVPFWLIWAFAGFQGMLEVWPAILVAGGSFALTQLVISNIHGPWLVDIIASVVSMLCLILFLLKWHPKRIWGLDGENAREARGSHGHARSNVVKAWMPWVILSVLVFAWGTPKVKAALDHLSAPKFPMHGLHMLVERVPPVVPKPTPEPAIYVLNWLSATGTGIFIAAIIAGLVMGLSIPRMLRLYGQTLARVRFSILTIAAMLGLGFLTRYSGLDATMGLAFARTGALYPFFGTLLGWLGVALTGSDTSSNVLFGSLQKISAQQVNVAPSLMASANSCGGVMGKMIDAQSIVVASTATQWNGHEGDILRYVFFHSIALA
ncbi:MAG TPA: L-lactate permease, partial [Terriglobales bacterium]|nr:L-lactate permease [Terriglobales bacterium]